jgi:PII-like signaling protein
MSSFEVIAVIFGSADSIIRLSLRVPVAFNIKTNPTALENFISIDRNPSNMCYYRYVVILLDPIDNELMNRLQSNDRVIIIYGRDLFKGHKQKPFIDDDQQFSIVLTADIVQFLITEGMKQATLKRNILAYFCYRKARILQNWIISFIKVILQFSISH